MARGSVGVLLLLVSGSLVWDASPASACMFGRRRAVQSTTAYYQPAVACNSCAAPAVAVAPVMAAPVVAAYVPPAPVAVQETRMVQRAYLAPVTTMQTQTQYENVTTYRTEFFDEAVTTMQTSAYYDPCGCGYKAVTTPVTSTVRRSRQVPVTQTIARNYVVPVTTYEQRVALEPVTETKLYYPAVAPAPVIAQYVAPVAPVAVAPVAAAPVAAVPAPTVAQYVPAAPAVAAPAVAPAAPAVAQYLPPAPPQAQAAPAAPQAGPAPQFYQNPTAQADDRTMIIERVVKNGQVIQENKRYLNPGEAVPPPQLPAPGTREAVPAPPEIRPQEAPAATPSSMPWQPFPQGRGNFTARIDSHLIPVSASAYYGTR